MNNIELMNNPIELLNKWLSEERAAGAPNPQQAVLSTATDQAVPHARVVAIREINDQWLLFFTQKKTRKVSELGINPIAAMVFWFELLQREVIIEGEVEPLSEVENTHYWQSYPREAQIRFYSYAPTSSESITSKQELEEKRKQIEQKFIGKQLPINEFYCGFKLKPKRTALLNLNS